MIIAMQKADKEQIATPADRQPCEDVIIPSPGSCGTARDRVADGTYCLDWLMFFKRRKSNFLDHWNFKG